MNRRHFLSQSAALAATPLLASLNWAAAPGANDRIRVAVMGIRGRGKSHIAALLAQPNVEIAYLCDVDKETFGPALALIEKAKGKAPTCVQDVRKVLEDNALDALTIATPNHWHSLAAIWACQAGKDVYVEKPISQTVVEGRRLVEAARKYKRVVQHGTQNRSNESIKAAVEFMQAGKLGKVTLARAVNYKRRQGIGRHNGPTPIPAGVDYDLWLGPAPRKELARLKLHYDWHWFWDYGSGDMGNQGVHQIDVALWGLGKKTLPRSVLSVGGRFAYEDDGETANTQVALFDYGDCRLIVEVRNLESKPLMGVRTGDIWYGTEGYITRDLNGGGNNCKLFLGNGKEGVVMGDPKADLGSLDKLHFANFIAAMRSRKWEDLRAEAEIGHVSSSLCHLANISYRLARDAEFGPSKSPYPDKDAAESFAQFQEHLEANKLMVKGMKYRIGRELTVDAVNENFGNDKEANALLSRTYRQPFEVPERV